MDHAQPQRLFERVEVAVAVEQGMTVDDAEAGDKAVNRLTDGLSACSELSIVAGGDGKVDATSIEDFELPALT